MSAHTRVAAFAALILLAACGGDDAGDAETTPQAQVAGAPSTPICDAVLPGELLSFTGRSFKPGVAKIADGQMYRCEWEPETDQQGLVSLTVYPDADASIGQYEALPGMTAVEGVGDAAWWSEQVQTYVVRLGTRLIVVGFGAPDGSHPQQAEQIVRRAMERV